MCFVSEASDASSILALRSRVIFSVGRYVIFSFRTNLSSAKLDLKKHSDRTLIIIFYLSRPNHFTPLLLLRTKNGLRGSLRVTAYFYYARTVCIEAPSDK